MKNIAIICEYNPFHKGHKEQIEIIRASEGDCRIISLMSGNSTQRGVPAICDKYTRARAAILCGSDIVLEIPFPYSSLCAEGFARAGVGIASAIGNIDMLAFGSECGDIGYLSAVCDRLTGDEFNSEFDMALKKDKKTPYLITKTRIYEKMYGERLPDSPNDILALEYIMSLRMTGSNIIPFTYKRHSEYSAGAAREKIVKGDYSYIPGGAETYIESAEKCDSELYGEIILSFIRRQKREYFDRIYDLPRDLADMFCTCAFACRDYRHFRELLSHSCYTNARISRCLIYCYCGIRGVGSIPPYTQLLAVNGRGREFLSQTRKTRTIDILTKPADHRTMSERAVSAFADSLVFDVLYSQLLSEKQSPADILKKMPYIFD